MEEEHHLKRIFLITMIISLSISALIGIIMFLIGDFGKVQTRILLTTLTIGGFSLAGLCSSVLYDKERAKIFAIIGMIFSFIGFLFITMMVWEMFDLEDSWRLGLTLILLSFTFAHVSLLLLIESDRTIVKASLWATLSFITIVALSLLLALWEIIDIEDFAVRWFGVFVILDALGTIITPIINKVTQLKKPIAMQQPVQVQPTG